MKIVHKLLGLVVVSGIFLIISRTAVVRAGVYGDSPQVDFSAITVPTCTNEKPKAPILLEPNHPALPKPQISGEVILVWIKVPGATSYTIAYGLTPGNYIYGAADIGSSESEVLSVRALDNRTYYFVVRANNGCMPGPFSQEWAARPLKGGASSVGGNVLAAATGFVPVPQIAVGRLPSQEDSYIAENTQFVEEETTVASTDFATLFKEGSDNAPLVQNRDFPQKQLVAKTETRSPGFLQNLFGYIFRVLFG